MTKPVQLTTYVTIREAREIRKKAKARGMSVSEYIREKLK